MNPYGLPEMDKGLYIDCYIHDTRGSSHGVLLLLVRLYTVVYCEATVIHLLIPSKGSTMSLALVCEKKGQQNNPLTQLHDMPRVAPTG